ncbi:MAG: LPS-assembly protein LptD [Candidatus Gastranaerophilales bacterium]|nr:LPS-assembly protein LptD [Candidatus Gastranaerophilales bacterium]
MKINNAKFNILLLATTLLLSCNLCFGAYEVVSAKTVINEDIKELKSDINIIPTENDPDLPDFVEEETVANYIKQKSKNLFRRKKNKLQNEEIQEPDKNEVSQKKEEINIQDKNKFEINADKISYDDTEGNVYASGNVEIVAKAQNVALKADNAVLDKTAQTIKLTGNVRIVKEGIEMVGDTLIVDLNEENVIMDNPVTDAYSFTIRAQESYLIANDLQMLNGTITSNEKKQYPFIPRHFYRYTPVDISTVYDPDNINETDLNRKKQTYRIDSKEIVITNYKDHNSLVLKGSNVYYNNHKIIPRSDIEIISDKDNQIIETNMPEAGTFRAFGTYVGYGITKRLPKGQLLKIMPAIVYGDSDLGVGLLGRHRSANSSLELGYSTATEKIVARGLYKFGNGFSLRYGRNAYISEGFMGARRSGYAAQLGYEKAYLDEEHDITFRNGVYAGLFSDYHKKGREHYFSTSRFRYSAELIKNFIQYKNKEQDLSISIGASAQASATVYGTGDVTGVVRIGPTLSTKLKKWESLIAYYQGGIHGDSPFEFDKYRYGRSNIVFNEKFNFNNFLSLGYAASISPNKDNYERDLMTESRFYAIIGPQDVKLAVSYDFVRDIGHLDLMFVLGSDNTKINFEKLTTKNLDESNRKQDFYKKAKTIKVIEDI